MKLLIIDQRGKLSSPEHKSIIIRIYKNINKRFLGNKLEKYNELIVYAICI